MRNKKFYIFIFLMFIYGLAHAQNEYKSEKIYDTEIFFFVDNVNETIPDKIIEKLKLVPLSELDDGLIYFLANTEKYQNINVKEMYNKNLKKTIFLVTAHSAKKIQNIIFEGINSYEQIAFQKNLTLQTGKNFKEYLIDEDIKKIENNIQSRGYPNARITGFKVKQASSNFVTLIYSLEKGSPCRIDQVVIENSNANILNFINLPIETGSLCDIPSVNDKLEQVKNNYLREGYLSASAKIKEIAFSPNRERAKLVLIIEKGPKTIVQIQNEKKIILNFDFLNSKQNALSYSDLLLSNDNDLNALLVNYYRNLGYPYVMVSGPERFQDTDKNIIINFSVNTGNQVKIKDVFFTADLPEDKNDVVKELQLDKGFFSSSIPFVQANLSVYKDRLKNIFLKNGYADAQIYAPDFTFTNEGREVNLVFNFIPGDRYILSAISIHNLPVGLNLNNKQLNEILKIGDPVNFDNKQSYADAIKTQLLNYGYLYSQVRIEQSIIQTDQEIKQVNLIVKVDPGPIVKIGKIYLEGDAFNKEKTIISISELKEGDIFSQQALDNARSHILRHDLFSSITIEPLDLSALDRKEDKLDIVIRGRGRSGYLLSLSPGWGNLRGYRFAVDYSLNKITEDGLRLISSAIVSQEKQQSSFASTDTKQILGEQLNFGFTEPLFKLGSLFTPLDLSIIAGYQVAAETLTNREYQTLKFMSEWKPSFFDYNWTFTSSLIHEKSVSTSSENAVIQTIDSPSLVIREFLNSVSLDTRNDIAWPTSGGFFSFGFGITRFGIGSEVQYNRYLTQTDIYFPMYKKLSGAILIGGVFLSDTINRNGETVTPPASRRSTLTDDALIRGFPETYGAAAPGPLLWIHYGQGNSEACMSQLASVGGTNLLYVKSEARYRLNDMFGLVGFVDTGESYLTPKEENQVNEQIQSQINPNSINSGQCSVDKARLISPAPKFEGADFLEQYWRQAYVSAGLGLRVILGNIASVSLDYGYPLKDPSQNQDDCMSPSDALSTDKNHPPHCISRLQVSSYDVGLFAFKFKGAVHLGIGAKF